MDKFIIGFGTGRCGSKSLATLLAKQPSIVSSHEGVELPWEYNPKKFVESLSQILFLSDNKTPCDVGFYWIQYLDKLINIFPNTKAIYLYRNKEEFIDSWLRNISMKNRKMHLFPDYNMESKEGLSEYYDYYDKKLNTLLDKYPDNIMPFHYYDLLNDESEQIEMLSFMGIPKAEQVIKTSILTNSSKSRIERAGNLITYNHDIRRYEVPQHGQANR